MAAAWITTRVTRVPLTYVMGGGPLAIAVSKHRTFVAFPFPPGPEV
jgi:hypothetical protein